MKQIVAELISLIESMPLAEKVEALNNVRVELHKISPFKNEPTDLVQWVKAESVGANDYNPNSVAKTEFELLKLSIEADGYTHSRL